MTHETTSGHEHDAGLHPGLRPRLPIRRFDVFAEYNRLRGLKRGLDQAHAKGYGLWVAKVVASGGGRRGSAKLEPNAPGSATGATQGQEGTGPQGWHILGGEPQTDALFDREIIQRMGPEFYHTVFAPAIDEAYDEGKSYEGIRDTIRKDWKPAHSS